MIKWDKIVGQSPHNHIPPVPPDPQPSRRHELLYRPGPHALGHVQLQPEQGQIPAPDHAADALPVLRAHELAKAETDAAGIVQVGLYVLGVKPGQRVEWGEVGRHGAA